MSILLVKICYQPINHLGKAFKKQIKTIEDQREKQIDALKDLQQAKAITYKTDDENDKTSTSKEICNEMLEEKIDEIL